MEGPGYQLIQLRDGNIASANTRICLWDVNGNSLKQFTPPPPVGTLYANISSLLELKSGIIVSGDSNYNIRLWNREGECINTVKGHSGYVRGLLELQNGLLASNSDDGSIKLWDSSMKCTGSFQNFGLSYGFIELRDGVLAVGSDSKMIYLWDNRGSPVATFAGHKHYVRALIELADGTLASGCADGTIKVWDRSGKCMMTTPSR